MAETWQAPQSGTHKKVNEGVSKLLGKDHDTEKGGERRSGALRKTRSSPDRIPKPAYNLRAENERPIVIKLPISFQSEGPRRVINWYVTLGKKRDSTLVQKARTYQGCAAGARDRPMESSFFQQNDGPPCYTARRWLKKDSASNF